MIPCYHLINREQSKEKQNNNYTCVVVVSLLQSNCLFYLLRIGVWLHATIDMLTMGNECVVETTSDMNMAKKKKEENDYLTFMVAIKH